MGLSAAALTVASAGAAAAEETEETEDFSYDSWDLSYQLSLDAQGRAHAEVTEELVAQFPEHDQNRGIIRSLPDRYQGAPAAPEDISVTDGSGNEVPFEVEDDDGFRSILVGDDSFVHGEQTYVISYTVDDVMHAAEQADEFYWDLVPADRNQDIGTVTADITMGPQLTAALTGSSACYVGTPGSTQSCTSVQKPGERSGAQQAVFSVEHDSLPGGHALTAAVGVDPGTVTQPPEREDSFALDVLPLLLAGTSALLAGGGCLAVWGMVRRRRRRPDERTPVEYGIPQGMTPLIAGPLAGAAQNPLVPTILDLAVRSAVRVIDAEEKPGWFSKNQKPAVELLDPQLAEDPLETQLLEGLFPDLRPGDVFTFPQHDKTFTKAAQKVLKDSRQALLDRGLMTRVRHRGAALAGAAALLPLIATGVLIIIGASRDNAVMTGISVVIGLLSVMLAVIAMFKHRVHTPEGAALRAQLQRVHQMLKASEGERLQMMQSYSGAGRRAAAPGESADAGVVEVYDRLLPYAVLFGLQKEWAAVLSSSYANHQLPAPVWYPALFNDGAQGVESSLNSMLSSVSSAASTASSGAGSTGGGAAGAGGGGGAAGGR